MSIVPVWSGFFSINCTLTEIRRRRMARRLQNSIFALSAARCAFHRGGCGGKLPFRRISAWRGGWSRRGRRQIEVSFRQTFHNAMIAFIAALPQAHHRWSLTLFSAVKCASTPAAERLSRQPELPSPRVLHQRPYAHPGHQRWAQQAPSGGSSGSVRRGGSGSACSTAVETASTVLSGAVDRRRSEKPRPTFWSDDRAFC